MIARLHNNGCEVRVDMGNTGKDWPACDNEQPGFPWLCKWPEGSALEAARTWARHHGATEIILSGFSERKNLRTLLIDCDSELSAIAHGRQPDKGKCLRLSSECRELYDNRR